MLSISNNININEIHTLTMATTLFTLAMVYQLKELPREILPCTGSKKPLSLYKILIGLTCKSNLVQAMLTHSYSTLLQSTAENS